MKARSTPEAGELFTKAAIMQNQDMICAVYADTGQWITQEIHDTGAFLELLAKSSRFGIRISRGEKIEMLFRMRQEGILSAYSLPKEKEMTREEMNRTLRQISPSERFIRFMEGADLDDEDQVLEKLRGWVSLLQEESKTKIVDLKAVQTWKKLSPNVEKLGRLLGRTVILAEPVGSSSGYGELQLPEKRRSVIWFDKETKKVFEELMEISDLLSFEMNPEKGYVNICFF